MNDLFTLTCGDAPLLLCDPAHGHDHPQRSERQLHRHRTEGGLGLGGQQNGFTIELVASSANGYANGNGVTNRDTQINGTDTATLTSGRDTNLRGAEVAGNTVDANVGRDLNIASQQDTNTYDSKQTSAGFQASICVPPICYGTTVSGSANASDQTIKDNYQSVNEQSGIYAGNGGYNVNVGNHTQLDGGVIASTATPDKNSLSTQTLGYTNLQNAASYSAESMGFGVSGSFGQSTPGGVNLNTPVKQAGSSTLGPQNSQGFGPSGFSAGGTGSSASGTTYAAVSAGKITAVPVKSPATVPLTAPATLPSPIPAPTPATTACDAIRAAPSSPHNAVSPLACASE